MKRLNLMTLGADLQSVRYKKHTSLKTIYIMNNSINNPFAKVRKIVARGIVCMLLFAVVSCDRTKEPHPLSSEKEIISFTVDGLIEYTMSIFEYVDRDYEFAAHIHALVSFDTELISLTPHIVVSPGAIISPVYAPPRNFSGIQRIQYTITAEDGTTARVIVFISHAPVPPELPEVSFTEFSLSDTSCGWIRLSSPNFSTGDKYLTIINSNEELRNHITCTEDYDFSFIDFSKYTLLLARGISSNSIRSRLLRGNLQQFSYRSYVMSVNFPASGLPAISHWYIAIITNKLDENDTIRLVIVR